VRIAAHRLLVGIIASSLIVSGAMPAGGAAVVKQPMGVVLTADRAQVGHGAAFTGASVYDGDQFQTGERGSMQARFGASMAYLLPQSSAVFHQIGRGYSADLSGGTLVASAAAGETFRLVANFADIRPENGQPTVAQVTVVSPTELLLTSRRGTLAVSAMGESRTVSEGTSYRMFIQPEEQGDPQNRTAAAGRRTGKLMWVLTTLAIAGTGVVIWRAVVSPKKP
jgi:hypothetical protein